MKTFLTAFLSALLSLSAFGATGVAVRSSGGSLTNGVLTSPISYGNGSRSNALFIAPNALIYTNGAGGLLVSNRTVIPNGGNDGNPAFLFAGQSYGWQPSSVHSLKWGDTSDFPIYIGYFGLGQIARGGLRFNSSASDSGAIPDVGIIRKAAGVLAVTDGNTDNTLVYKDLTARNLISTNTIISTNGFASFSPTAAAAIAATGWTNIWSTNNATVYVTATAVAFTIKDRAAATLYTSPTLTATISVNLQPGWSVNSASGLAGTALPW